MAFVPPCFKSDIIHVEWCFISGLSPASLTYTTDIKVTTNLPEITPSIYLTNDGKIITTYVIANQMCCCVDVAQASALVIFIGPELCYLKWKL